MGDMITPCHGWVNAGQTEWNTPPLFFPLNPTSRHSELLTAPAPTTGAFPASQVWGVVEGERGSLVTWVSFVGSLLLPDPASTHQEMLKDELAFTNMRFAEECLHLKRDNGPESYFLSPFLIKQQKARRVNCSPPTSSEKGGGPGGVFLDRVNNCWVTVWATRTRTENKKHTENRWRRRIHRRTQKCFTHKNHFHMGESEEPKQDRD